MIANNIFEQKCIFATNSFSAKQRNARNDIMIDNSYKLYITILV